MKKKYRFHNYKLIIGIYICLIIIYFTYDLKRYIKLDISSLSSNFVIFSYLSGILLYGIKSHNNKISKHVIFAIIFFIFIFYFNLFWNIEIKDPLLVYFSSFYSFILFCFLILLTLDIILEWENIFDINVIKNIYKQKIEMDFALKEISKNVKQRENFIILNDLNIFFKLEVSNFESYFKIKFLFRRKNKKNFKSLLKDPNNMEKYKILKICRKYYYLSTEALKKEVLW